MLEGEIHKTLIKLRSGLGTGGHVGIVDPHQLGLGKVHIFELVEVRQPSVFLLQIVLLDLPSDKVDRRRIGRIAGVRNQDNVARIDEGKADKEDSLLGADERLYSSVGIEGHAVVTGVPVCESLAKHGQTLVVLVLVTVGSLSDLSQGVNCCLGRHSVRSTYSEIDEGAETFCSPFSGNCIEVFLLA